MAATMRSELTITQAAETFGVPRRSIARAAERGQIPSDRIGNLVVVDREAVRLYAAVFEARRRLDEYVTATAAARSSDVVRPVSVSALV
ncbi:helix-turn-helix domain-containing protein, partial [Mycolicibacterium iranicum]|uniref:helix-turn-helix domain-containing protein n=1 Tax=Mycolicibacterium iranicum TaxID=912594 RepID=UPI0007D8EFD0